MSAPVLPQRHDDYEALAVAWAIGALEPVDQEIFEAHQSGCADCARIVRMALGVAVELAYGVPDVDPPPLLRRRLLAAATPRPPAPTRSPEMTDPRRGSDRTALVGGRMSPPRSKDGDLISPPGSRDGDLISPPGGRDGDRPAPASSREGRTVPAPADRPPTSHRYGGRRPANRASNPLDQPGPVAPGRGRDRAGRPGAPRRRRLVSVLVAAVLVGLSAVTTWQVTRPGSAAAPTAAADRVAALNAQVGDRTVATVVARNGRVTVVTDGLRPNAGRDTQYYLWGVPDGGAGTPQVVGRFTVTTTGLHSYAVVLTQPIDDYPVVAVSEERAGSTPTRPSSVLARGALGR